jgi:uncharacterized cysteine cluster protein YcgN (CxxCxxCC family)
MCSHAITIKANASLNGDTCQCQHYQERVSFSVSQLHFEASNAQR